jgi:hypothetical protein
MFGPIFLNVTAPPMFRMSLHCLHVHKITHSSLCHSIYRSLVFYSFSPFLLGPPNVSRHPCHSVPPILTSRDPNGVGHVECETSKIVRTDRRTGTCNSFRLSDRIQSTRRRCRRTDGEDGLLGARGTGLRSRERKANVLQATNLMTRVIFSSYCRSRSSARCRPVVRVRELPRGYA